MDIPFNIEEDKMYSITVEPSPYVLGLERRVEQLEKREELVNRMYKALVDNGFIKENLGRDVEELEGGRNEYELIVGRELMMDVDEIDWQGRETPPPFLERENTTVSEAAGSSQPPDITNEGFSDVLASPKLKEDVIETGAGGRVSDASTEAIKTRARRRRPKLTSVNRHMCLTCDEDFSRSVLYKHCQTTGHGRHCADYKFYLASAWKRHLSHCTEVHDESSSSGSAEAKVETVATSLKRKTSRPIQKPKASSKKKVPSNWSCMQCDKSYSLEHSLHRHCRKQKPRHGMYCTFAGKWFNTKMSWAKHTSSCLFIHQECLDASIRPQPSTSGSAVLEKQVQRTKKYSILEACAACKDGGGDLLLCSNVECPVLYHLSCLDPPLKEVPEGDWFCTGCEAQREAEHRGSSSPEQQVELAEDSSLVEQYVVAAAVSSMMASKGNQHKEGTIAARKTKIGRGGQMRVPKPKEPVESAVEQDGVNQSSSVSQNDDGTGLMGLQLETVIGDGNNVEGGAKPDSIPAMKLRVLGKILAELESMQGSNSNAK